MTYVLVTCRLCHQLVPESWCLETRRDVWVCVDGCRRSQGIVEMGLVKVIDGGLR